MLLLAIYDAFSKTAEKNLKKLKIVGTFAKVVVYSKRGLFHAPICYIRRFFENRRKNLKKMKNFRLFAKSLRI